MQVREPSTWVNIYPREGPKRKIEKVRGTGLDTKRPKGTRHPGWGPAVARISMMALRGLLSWGGPEDALSEVCE